MKRVLLLTALALVVLVGSVSAVPVLVNTDPAPHEWPSAWACYPTCILPVDIVAGDLGTADGWIDLAVLCQATGQVAFYENNRVGVFNAAQIKPPAASLLRFAAGRQLAINGNAVDVLYGLPAASQLGSATPSSFGLDIAVLPSPVYAIGTADLDHDLAIETALLMTGGIRIVKAGVPGPLFPTGGGEPLVALAIADMNQDAWFDVVTVTASGTVYIFWNLRGPFAASPAVATGIQSATSIAVGDFDGDGFNDFVVAGTNPPNIGMTDSRYGYAQVFLNQLSANPNGFVGFAANGVPMNTWGFETSDVVAFDADGNGRDDFAVTNWASDTVTVFLSNATQIREDGRARRPEYCLPDAQMKDEIRRIDFYVYKLGIHCGHYPIALVAADFDFNGKPDLAIALQSADEEICAQNPSCIEIIFDPACGFHPSGMNAAAQSPHQNIVGVSGEEKECEPCMEGDCEKNEAPDAEIEEAENSGNP